MLPAIDATFMGAAIFGNADSFQAPELGFPEPGIPDPLPVIDSFLSLPPGTTVFGAAPGGRIWLCSGVMIDDTTDGIILQKNTMLSFAEMSGPFGRPTGVTWPMNFMTWKNSRFRLAETQFDPTVAYAGNRYSANFRTVMRSISNS